MMNRGLLKWLKSEKKRAWVLHDKLDGWMDGWIMVKCTTTTCTIMRPLPPRTTRREYG